MACEQPLMSVRIVRLGEKRTSGEGLRIGTVRYPPRGVPKARYAAENWFDVWLPELAPAPATMKLAQGAVTARQWAAFVRKYRAEMGRPPAGRILDTLAALSRQANFSVGCYCAEEARCHRSVLRELLKEHGAKLEAP
jgi:uncharacterized protein YeaO (DUF488 family)